MRKIIAVDVDETIVDVYNPWKEWYKNLTGHEIKVQQTYNVQELMDRHEDPLVFFKNPNLYDTLKPRPDAVEVLNDLSKEYDIVFVSHCFPEHEKSKLYFLKRNFNFDFKFISTKDKEAVKMDVFIDDNISMLNKVKEYQPDVFCIQYCSEISVTNNDFTKCYYWYDIEEKINEEIGEKF